MRETARPTAIAAAYYNIMAVRRLRQAPAAGAHGVMLSGATACDRDEREYGEATRLLVKQKHICLHDMKWATTAAASTRQAVWAALYLSALSKNSKGTYPVRAYLSSMRGAGQLTERRAPAGGICRLVWRPMANARSSACQYLLLLAATPTS